jgi:hypothetical protein
MPKSFGHLKKSCYIHDIHFVRDFFFLFFSFFFLGRTNFLYNFFFGKISPNFSKTSGIYTRKTRFNFRKFLFLQKKEKTSTHTHELHVGLNSFNLLNYVFIHYNTNSVIFSFILLQNRKGEFVELFWNLSPPMSMALKYKQVTICFETLLM